MKPRIAAFGGGAEHKLIVPMPRFGASQSIADFDAVLFDPSQLVSEWRGRFSEDGSGHFIPRSRANNQEASESLTRRQHEFKAFLDRRGGVIICLLRARLEEFFLDHPGGGRQAATPYSVFDDVCTYERLPLEFIQGGYGERFEAVEKSDRSVAAYFQILSNHLAAEAHFAIRPGMSSGSVLALNPLGFPVAMSFQCGSGMLYCLPVPVRTDPNRIGAAITEMVRRYYGGSLEIEAPAWVPQIQVPGANQYDEEILQVSERVAELQAGLADLEAKREGILRFRRLLFGTGTAVLEPIVRSAFHLLGFEVPEPDEYEEQWDALLRDGALGYGIAEIEGPEGAVDLDKYRQLRDYIDDEITAGRCPKGFLVGNGYRLHPLEAEERTRQFTEAAMRGGSKQGFCLLPTSELFKAVCRVFEFPNNEELKRAIRESLWNTVGVWSFESAFGEVGHRTEVEEV